MFTGGLMIEFQFIVCARNNADIILDCLKSIKQLKKKKDWVFRIIVIDDHSTDRTVEVIKQFDSSILIESYYYSHGPAYCKNGGMKYYNPDYFFFLDSDVSLKPECLINLMNVMTSKKIGICGPKLYLENGLLNAAGGGLTKTGFGFDIGYNKPDSHPRYDSQKDCMYICSAAMLVRAELKDAIGKFDANYFYGHEDTDYCWRANLAGYRVVYVPQAIAIHKKSQTVSRNDEMIHYHAVKNRLASIIKNYNFINMCFYSGCYILISIGDILFRDYKKAKLKGLCVALFDLPFNLSDRKRIQQLRKKQDKELPFNGWLPPK